MHLVFMYCILSSVFFQSTNCFAGEKFHDTAIYLFDHVTYGHVIRGPAIIIEKHR